MVLNTLHDWVLFLIPMIAIFITSSVCKIGKNAGANVKFRPPASVFGIVWFCLTLLLGLSWVFCISSTKNQQSDVDQVDQNQKLITYVIYTLLIISLMLWIIFYGCNSNPLSAIWTLIPSIALSLMAFSLGSYISKILISPLIAWIVFAMMMATHEYQLSGSNN
jgi:tryptophan-rich sensory protein